MNCHIYRYFFIYRPYLVAETRFVKHVLNFSNFFCFFFLYALIFLFLFHDRPTLSDSSFSSSQTKSDEPKMQTMKKNHEQDPANQGEDDCSMLGLEPRCRRRNRETELVQNPQKFKPSGM